MQTRTGSAITNALVVAALVCTLGACASTSASSTSASPATGSSTASSGGTTSAAAASAAAASAATSSAETIRRGDVLFSDPVVSTIFKDAPTASVRRLAGTVDEVTAALRLVYGNIEVPITVDDPRRMQLGNPDFYRTRNFAGESMAKLLQCGSSMTGAAASSYRIYISLLSNVVPDGPGYVKAGVLFTATARNIAESASNYRVSCGSTGVLELKMLDKVASYLPKR